MWGAAWHGHAGGAEARPHVSEDRGTTLGTSSSCQSVLEVEGVKVATVFLAGFCFWLAVWAFVTSGSLMLTLYSLFLPQADMDSLEGNTAPVPAHKPFHPSQQTSHSSPPAPRACPPVVGVRGGLCCGSEGLCESRMASTLLGVQRSHWATGPQTSGQGPRLLLAARIASHGPKCRATDQDAPGDTVPQEAKLPSSSLPVPSVPW